MATSMVTEMFSIRADRLRNSLVWFLSMWPLRYASISPIDWYLCKAHLSHIKNGFIPSLFALNSECTKVNKLGTVLSILLEKNYSKTCSENDDVYSFQNLQHIPDISIAEKLTYTYWYIGYIQTDRIDSNYDITNPESTKFNKMFIHFHGINYRPEFYINAQRVYDMNYQTSIGMFRRYSLDITDYIYTKPSTNNRTPSYITEQSSSTYQHSLKTTSNIISVLVHPPDYPGSVPSSGGQGGDHIIAKNGAIMQCTAGWDWIQATPDRNTVITNNAACYYLQL